MEKKIREGEVGGAPSVNRRVQKKNAAPLLAFPRLSLTASLAHHCPGILAGAPIAKEVTAAAATAATVAAAAATASATPTAAVCVNLMGEKRREVCECGGFNCGADAPAMR